MSKIRMRVKRDNTVSLFTTCKVNRDLRSFGVKFFAQTPQPSLDGEGIRQGMRHLLEQREKAQVAASKPRSD